MTNSLMPNGVQVPSDNFKTVFVMNKVLFRRLICFLSSSCHHAQHYGASPWQWQVYLDFHQVVLTVLLHIRYMYRRISMRPCWLRHLLCRKWQCASMSAAQEVREKYRLTVRFGAKFFRERSRENGWTIYLRCDFVIQILSYCEEVYKMWLFGR